MADGNVTEVARSQLIAEMADMVGEIRAVIGRMEDRGDRVPLELDEKVDTLEQRITELKGEAEKTPA